MWGRSMSINRRSKRGSSYSTCTVLGSVIRKPFLIYDFAADPIWISLYIRGNFLFFFKSATAFKIYFAKYILFCEIIMIRSCFWSSFVRWPTYRMYNLYITSRHSKLDTASDHAIDYWHFFPEESLTVSFFGSSLFKGIFQPFELGGVTRLIRWAVKFWKAGN